jgi:hypothetical protein
VIAKGPLPFGPRAVSSETLWRSWTFLRPAPRRVVVKPGRLTSSANESLSFTIASTASSSSLTSPTSRSLVLMCATVTSRLAVPSSTPSVTPMRAMGSRSPKATSASAPFESACPKTSVSGLLTETVYDLPGRNEPFRSSSEYSSSSLIHEGQRSFTGGSTDSAFFRSLTFTGFDRRTRMPSGASHLAPTRYDAQRTSSTTSGP